MAAAPSIFSSRHVEAPLVKSSLCLADSLARAAKERKGSRAEAYLRQAGPALHEEKAVANGLANF